MELTCAQIDSGLLAGKTATAIAWISTALYLSLAAASALCQQSVLFKYALIRWSWYAVSIENNTYSYCNATSRWSILKQWLIPVCIKVYSATRATYWTSDIVGTGIGPHAERKSQWSVAVRVIIVWIGEAVVRRVATAEVII
jgi:hypothetical protein